MGRRPASIIGATSTGMTNASPTGMPPSLNPSLFKPRASGRPNAGDLDSVDELTERLKTDLRRRLVGGEAATAADYLIKYPELALRRDKALSLIYEEYCLLEECNRTPDANEFCERNAAWTTSLSEQIRCHRMFSQAAEPRTLTPRFPIADEFFASFRILSEIGQGGAARVYLAADEALGGREVVLKVSADRGNEASIQGRLDHPNIVPVHSVVQEQDSNLRALCMPYRPGLPLDVVITRLHRGSKPRSALAIWHTLAPESESYTGQTQPRFPEEPGWKGFPIKGDFSEGVAWIIQKIAAALHYSHSKGIFHRDVKPANILITLKDGPQLLDFNLAHAPHSPEQAAVALRGGTLPYMAPEQLDAFRRPERWEDVGASSDLYSLALVTRELLDGEPPVVQDPKHSLAATLNELIERRTSNRPWASLRETNPRTPHALEAIINLCLAAEPASRYPDADSLSIDLLRFLRHQPTRFARNRSRSELASNWVKRNRRVLVLGCVPLLVAGFIGAAEFTRSLTPFENRAEFNAAVENFEASKFEKAQSQLRDLKGSGMNFPLLWIYLAATYRSGPIPDELLPPIANIWTTEGSIGKLDEWANGHSSFLGDLEQLSANLYSQAPSGNADRDLARKNTVKLAIDFIFQRDPTRVMTRRLRALFLEEKAKFAESYAILCGLVKDESKSESAESRRTLWPILQSRARVLTSWVGASLRPKGPELEPGRAQSLLNEAFRDIDLNKKIVAQLANEQLIPASAARNDKFSTDYIECEARIAEGDLFKAIGLPREANAAYATASHLQKGFAEFGASVLDAPYYKDLERRVQSRLNKAPASSATAPRSKTAR